MLHESQKTCINPENRKSPLPGILRFPSPGSLPHPRISGNHFRGLRPLINACSPPVSDPENSTSLLSYVIHTYPSIDRDSIVGNPACGENAEGQNLELSSTFETPIYVYIHRYIYIYIYIDINTRRKTHITCIYIYILYLFIYLFTYVFIYLFLCMYVCVCIHMYIYIYIYIYLSVCVCVIM